MATTKVPQDRKPKAKAASGPAPQPTQITSTDEWLASAEGKLTELPSGKVVRVRMPGMDAFIKANLLPNNLLPIVMSAVDTGEGVDDETIAEMAKDPERLLELVDAFDNIFRYCVTEPVFAQAPEDPTARVAGVLYSDLVSMEDKGYLFQMAVGGTADLETFRREQAASVARIQSS